MLIRSGWGDELLPISGHLGNREPIVKPTSTEVGFYFCESQRKGGGKFKGQRQNKSINPREKEVIDRENTKNKANPYSNT